MFAGNLSDSGDFDRPTNGSRSGGDMFDQRSRWVGRIAVAAAAITAASVLGACGSSGGDSANAKQTIRFVWWGNEDRANATKQAVTLFEKANPNITVQTEFSGYDAYVQKLTTQIAGGNAPDVIQLDRPTFGEYIDKHALQSLQPYLSDKSLDLSKVPSVLLSGEKSDGEQYAVPAGQTTQMIVYNADTFAKAGVTVPATGWTWSDFTADMQKIKQATGKAGTTDFGWAVDWFDSWLHQRGKSLYTSGGKLGFTADDLTQFWTLTDGMRKQGIATSASATTKMDGSTQNSALIAGQSAAEQNYDSNLTGYVTAAKDTLKAAPLPSDTPGAATSGMAALPPVYYAIPRTSSHKSAGAKLLSFLVNNAAAGKALGATRGLPESSAIRSSVCAAAVEPAKSVCTFETQIQSKIGPSASWSWPRGSSEIKTDFQQVYDNVIFGKSSVSSAAHQLVSDAQQALNQ